MFKCGGTAPSDLLIQKRTMERLGKDPEGFAFAFALDPEYRFTTEEVNMLEGKLSPSQAVNRVISGPMVTWTMVEREAPLWKGGKHMEGVTTAKSPYIMGGCGTFWPMPLQREGPHTTKMRRVLLPEGPPSAFLSKLALDLTKQLKIERFWTLSKR